MSDGDHFSSAGDWKNMKPKQVREEPKIKIRKPRVPQLRSQSDIKKIAQLREDIVLTATEHDKTIDELAEAQTEIAQLKEQLEACRNRYRTKMLDSFDADLATLRARNAELEAEVEHLKSEIQLIIAPPEAVGRVVHELKAEVERLKDFRGGTIHNSWLTAPREKLIEALQFQGATTKEAFKLSDEYRSEVARLRKALKHFADKAFLADTEGDLKIMSNFQSGGLFIADHVAKIAKAALGDSDV